MKLSDSERTASLESQDETASSRLATDVSYPNAHVRNFKRLKETFNEMLSKDKTAPEGDLVSEKELTQIVSSAPKPH
ncbi:MAG: hypothetical protein P1U32_04860 [Legionellaceae bacterium]|nr:hypothetical protein [Legionellaceae bacterium]